MSEDKSLEEFLYGEVDFKIEDPAINQESDHKEDEAHEKEENTLALLDSDSDEHVSSVSEESIDLVMDKALSETEIASAMEINTAEPVIDAAEASETISVDVNKVGTYNDIPITNISLDSCTETPWRNPGADITDYFNYGFDEVTWGAYCQKQHIMREGVGMIKRSTLNDKEQPRGKWNGNQSAKRTFNNSQDQKSDKRYLDSRKSHGSEGVKGTRVFDGEGRDGDRGKKHDRRPFRHDSRSDYNNRAHRDGQRFVDRDDTRDREKVDRHHKFGDSKKPNQRHNTMNKRTFAS